MHKKFQKKYIYPSGLNGQHFNKTKKQQDLNKNSFIRLLFFWMIFFVSIKTSADFLDQPEKKESAVFFNSKTVQPWDSVDSSSTSILKSAIASDYPWREKKKKGIKLDLKTFHVFKTKQFAFYPGAAVFYRHPSINIDLGYQYSSLEKHHYYRISSLAVNFPLPMEKFLLSVGFKNHLWSQADRYWNYGFWQPRYLIDPLRPKQIGLPGLYLSYKGDSSLIFYASPFILPDIDARIRLTEGRPVSKSPFFDTPFQIKKETSKFSWEIEDLKSFSLLDVLKPAFAFQINHKTRFSGLSFSYAYKPVNRPQYSVLIPKTKLSSLPSVPDIFSLDEEELEKSLPKKPPIYHIKNLEYTFLHHHLATLEAEMLPSPYLSLTGSLTYENPESLDLSDPLWVSQGRESHLTAAFLFRIKDSINKQEAVFFTLAYSDVFEIKSRTPNTNVWLKEYQYYFSGGKDWKNSLATSLEYSTKAILKGYDFNIRLNYALDNKLYLLSFENSASFSSSFRIYLSGDLFLKFAEQAASFSSSYITRYRNMSRIIAGAEYVF